jgi:hypothetical protein
MPETRVFPERGARLGRSPPFFSGAATSDVLSAKGPVLLKCDRGLERRADPSPRAHPNEAHRCRSAVLGLASARLWGTTTLIPAFAANGPVASLPRDSGDHRPFLRWRHKRRPISQGTCAPESLGDSSVAPILPPRAHPSEAPALSTPAVAAWIGRCPIFGNDLTHSTVSSKLPRVSPGRRLMRSRSYLAAAIPFAANAYRCESQRPLRCRCPCA